VHVIALSNQKGGCGKTTSAINIAASLASLGQRTLLMDLDPQAHTTFGVGVRGEEPACSAGGLRSTMYNVLTEQPDKKDFLENTLISIDTNLDLAPSHILLSTIEQEFTNKDESVSKLYEILNHLSFPYDMVVIDCPPSLGFLTFNALRASEMVLVPIELGSFSLMGVGKLLSMIELIRVKLEHTPKVFALPTMVDMRTRFAKHMIEEIRVAFGEHILSSAVRQAIAVKESQAKGVPLVKYGPKSRAAVDYLILSQEILQILFSVPSLLLEQNSARNSVPSSSLRDFVFKAKGVKEVYLVGDFNNWSLSNQSLLWQTEEGLWQKRICLEPGRYRYKFVVDGEWTTDPENDRLEPNPYGGLDSVLEIE